MGKGNVFFLKVKSVPRTLKLTMKGKKLDQHVLENQKRNSNNRGKWMDRLEHPLLALIQRLHGSDFRPCQCCMDFVPLGL